jgi:hypothetical protein
MASYVVGVALGVIIVEVFLLYHGIKHRRRVKLIENTPVTEVRRLEFGPAKINGRVVALDDVLESPLLGTRCVHYRIKVQSWRKGGARGGGGWVTVVNDVQSVPFGVDDGTGIVAVSQDGAELVLKKGITYPFNPGDDPATFLFETQTLRERYPRASWWCYSETERRFTETVIAEGQRLLLVGTIQPISGGSLQFEKGKTPLIVSGLTERALLARYRWKARIWWLLAGLVLAAGSVGLVAVANGKP